VAHLGLRRGDRREGGVGSIEHLTGVPEAAGLAKPLMAAHQKGFFTGWTAFERSWATLDSAALTRVAQQLATTQVTMVPTLALHEIFSRLDDSTLQQNPDLQAMPAALKAAWNVPDMIRRAGWTAEDFAAFRKSRPYQDLFLRAFHAAGGRIVTGTDAANQMLVPGASEHTELELLVRADSHRPTPSAPPHATRPCSAPTPSAPWPSARWISSCSRGTRSRTSVHPIRDP
jgi:hypothetical protein